MTKTIEALVPQGKKPAAFDEQMYLDMLEMAQVAYWHWNLITGEQLGSSELRELLGLHPKGCSLSKDFVLSTAHPEDRAAIQAVRRTALSKNRPYALEFRIIAKNGHERPVLVRGKVYSNHSGKPMQLLEIFQEADRKNQGTETLRASERSIAHTAYLDSLTGLPNRQGFYDRLAETLERAKRHKSVFALLYIDLDNFKAINETKGHALGDLLLQEIAGRLRDCARSGDPLARLSGDEFTLILEKLPQGKEAAVVAKRIIDSLSKPFHYRAKSIYPTVSIGISVYPENGTSAEALLKNADAAMSHAKETGKNRFHFFTKALNEKILKQAALEAALRKSIEKGELEAYFQPIVSLKDRSIVSMEALIRWPQAGGGFISPGEFIPLAEEKGLIPDIDHFMIHAACGFVQSVTANTTNGSAQDTHVSVNLSAVDFERTDLCKQLTEVVQRFGLAPQNIGVEITESAVIKNMDLAIQHLNMLRAHGFSISIDDFGTGYSSLNYLARLPIDILKIDGSFVVDLPGNHRNCAIAKAIVLMAHEMGIQVVAEGVETQAQLDFLHAIGCDKIQGYIFSPALPGCQMADLLKQPQPFTGKGAVFSHAPFR